VDKKSHQRTCEGEGHPRHLDIARQKKIDTHEGGGDGTHATRQPVHIVQQVESVRDPYEPEQGDHHVHQIIPGQPNADATHEQHRGRSELPDQLGTGPQLDEIVDQAECEDHHGGEKQPVPMGEGNHGARRDLPNGQVSGDQERLHHDGHGESHEDRYSAEIGRRPPVPTLRRRGRQPSPLQSGCPNEGREHHRGEQGQAPDQKQENGARQVHVRRSPWTAMISTPVSPTDSGRGLVRQ
jgi:hypothetical protein